ncbi:MAG: hypothetical protein GJV46_10620 [Geobacter sp.]|nr:hypothetical protein [Geobacter sp.]
MLLINFYKTTILALLIILADINCVSAFNIVPELSASQKSFVPSITYETDDGIHGIITRQPIAFASIVRGGSDDFLKALESDFPPSKGWKFIPAKEDLQGSFAVSAYYVFFDNRIGGGGISFDYIPGEGDPVSSNKKELHWIQRIISNHKRRSSHGTSEDRIAVRSPSDSKSGVPFFDVVIKSAQHNPPQTLALPPHFEYDVHKNDPENDHEWKSETYLASIDKKDPKKVTIYNGVTWGWQNKVNKADLPAVR